MLHSVLKSQTMIAKAAVKELGMLLQKKPQRQAAVDDDFSDSSDEGDNGIGNVPKAIVDAGRAEDAETNL